MFRRARSAGPARSVRPEGSSTADQADKWPQVEAVRKLLTSHGTLTGPTDPKSFGPFFEALEEKGIKLIQDGPAEALPAVVHGVRDGALVGIDFAPASSLKVGPIQEEVAQKRRQARQRGQAFVVVAAEEAVEEPKEAANKVTDGVETLTH